ncbi:hypothetical protein C0J45_9960 [Silurus meridionalis]|nr:hypothetical protein C0J45_9960 [Silurus meridionalis]
MARLLGVQLIMSVFMQITLADIMSVLPGENITLTCSITNHSQIWWYQLRFEEIKLLIFARIQQVDKVYSPTWNADENHFDLNEDRSLEIIGVQETDLGFYFCGGQNKTHNDFGKPIRVNFTDNRNPESTVLSTYLDRFQTINIILTCLCSISFLINITCVCVFRSRVQGKSVLSHPCCSDPNTTHSAEKEMNLHYATFTHKTEPGYKNTSDLDGVLYAGIRYLPA